MNAESVQTKPIPVPGYVTGEEIGRGAHGVVYRGHVQGKPDEQVAIKVIENRGNLDRLLIEPDILKRLSHPHIVRLYESFLVGEQLVLIMELLGGTDLKTLIETSGPLSGQEVRRMLAELGEALAHAHSHDIVHCDIKPNNIIVVGKDGESRYVLTDFGVSRMTGGLQTRPRLAGTYLYMAPEQIRGRVEAQSDLWGLGAVAVTMLSGKPPFRGNSLPSLIRAISYEAPAPIEDVAGSGLSQVIEHLLEKPLTSRTGSAADLCEELKRIEKLKETPLPPLLARMERDVCAGNDAWESRSTQALRKSWTNFWIGAVLFAIPGGIIGSGVEFVGALLIWQWCLSRSEIKPEGGWFKRWLWLPGLLTLGIGFLLDMAWFALLPSMLGLHDSDSINTLGFVTLFLPLPGAFIAMRAFRQVRLLKRQLSLRRALQAANQNTSNLVEIMRKLVEAYPGETSLHLRFTESLLYYDRPADAVVEAQIVLEDDPYNFDAMLHLAEGYYALGLMEQCAQVCNAYLAVSPISFEFSEMRNRAMAVKGGPAETQATVGEELTR